MKPTVGEDQARQSVRNGVWNLGRGEGLDPKRIFGQADRYDVIEGGFAR